MLTSTNTRQVDSYRITVIPWENAEKKFETDNGENLLDHLNPGDRIICFKMDCKYGKSKYFIENADGIIHTRLVRKRNDVEEEIEIRIPHAEALEKFILRSNREPIQLVATDQVIKHIKKAKGQISPYTTHFILHADRSRTPIISIKRLYATAGRNKALPVPETIPQIPSVPLMRDLSFDLNPDEFKQDDSELDLPPIVALKYSNFSNDPDTLTLPFHPEPVAIALQETGKKPRLSIFDKPPQLQNENIAEEKKEIPESSLASVMPKTVLDLFKDYFWEALLFPMRRSLIRPDVAFINCFMGAKKNDSRFCQIRIDELIRKVAISLSFERHDFVNTQWKNNKLIEEEIQAGLLDSMLMQPEYSLEASRHLVDSLTQFYLKIAEIFFIDILKNRNIEEICTLWSANELFQDYFSGLPVVIENRNYRPLQIDRVFGLFHEALNSNAERVYKAIWDKNANNLSQKIKSLNIDCQLHLLLQMCANIPPRRNRSIPFIVNYIKSLYSESQRKELKKYLAALPSIPGANPEELKKTLLGHLSHREVVPIPEGAATALGQFGICSLRRELPSSVHSGMNEVQPAFEWEIDLTSGPYLDR